MSVIADCRENRDLAGHRVSRAGLGRGGACLTCLLALVGLYWIASTAAADSGAAAVAGVAPAVEDECPFERPAVPVRGHSKSKVEKTGHSRGLVAETENA